MIEFITAAGAVAAVVIPVAFIQARNTRLSLDNAIRANNDELLKRINGTYVKKEVLDLRLIEVDRRLGHIEGIVD